MADPDDAFAFAYAPARRRPPPRPPILQNDSTISPSPFQHQHHSYYSSRLPPLQSTQRFLGEHHNQEHELHDINTLLEENSALKKSYQEIYNRAYQQDKILHNLLGFIAEIEKPAEGLEDLLDPHAARTNTASQADRLLLPIQGDWSGRGSHVELQRGESIPLEIGRVLGHGTNGEVVEATCKGVKVALKTIYYRSRSHIRFEEINILKAIKHRHIVRLIGSYIQNPYLGLLTWPVAQCDLSVVLDFLDLCPLHNQPATQISEFLERLAHLGLDAEELQTIVGDQDKRIWSSFGCVIGALAYLHDNKIRHKDIKPSNILFSRDGVWLTDFGSAKDFSSDLTSTSESRERGTLTYCAPEVYGFEESGRSADIFSLGCVFLEMMVVLTHSHRLAELGKLRPSKNGLYGANLVNIDKWLDLAWSTELHSQHLLNEIKQMLNHNRSRRPTADALTFRISRLNLDNDGQCTRRLCGLCCTLSFNGELQAYEERVAKLEDEVRKNLNLRLKVKELLESWS